MTKGSNNSDFNTRHTLLDRARNQDDKSAWSEFVEYYEQYIYNILRHIGLPTHDAEELCQDILVKLWKKLPEFTYDSARGKFRSWLGVMIRNDANRYFYTKNRKDKVIETNEDALANNQDISNDLNIDEIIESEWDSYIANLAWENVRGRFKENTQKAFTMYLEDIEVDKIAEELKVKKNTVYVYINRIETHIKEEIRNLSDQLL